jgi:UDP-N-acetylglucosamine--N-acetylmuramyl-(pentapeptide) pyrophosphoryl-undecaprenol N-acetylglucosamine transferase
MSGLKRGLSPKDVVYNFKTAKNLVIAQFVASQLIKRFKPDVVIGTGGYICYPVLKKASKKGIPTVIHDSNALPGLTTKLLSPFVDMVLVSFPSQNIKWKKPERVIFTGTPLHEGFNETVNKEKSSKEKTKPLVLSFWGSLGAENMNEIIAEVIKLNADSCEFDHLHAVGKNNTVDEMNRNLNRIGFNTALPSNIEIREYIDDMPSVMANADLVICRGGGSTIAELIALNKPAILVPSPFVANNEQELNSQQLVKAGGAIIISEESCTGEILYNEIVSLLNDKNKLSTMTENIKSLFVTDATGKIVDLILTLI